MSYLEMTLYFSLSFLNDKYPWPVFPTISSGSVSVAIALNLYLFWARGPMGQSTGLFFTVAGSGDRNIARSRLYAQLLDECAFTRQQQELEIHQRVSDGAGIVTLYGSFYERHYQYMVMKLCPDRDLGY
jgi:hypothetical protein